MKYSRNTWIQIRIMCIEQWIHALEKDGYELDESSDSKLIYRHPVKKKRIVMHYHPKKIFSEKILEGLLNDIGWTEKDMKRLKLIK